MDEFDIGAFDAQDEATLAIVNPKTKETTTWVWTFYGPGHAATLAVADRLTKRYLAEEREKVAAQVNNRKYKPDDRSADELRAENVKNLVQRVKSFTPVVLNGEKIEFSPSKAEELLLDPRKGWLFSQISEFLKEEASFIRPSAKS